MKCEQCRVIPCALAVVVLLVSSPAHAQPAPKRPYVFGGWSLQVREGMELTGVTFGGGLPLTAALKVEGSLGWHARMTSDDSLNVSFGHFQTHSTDQDVPLVGAVRWSLPCAGRVCADVVGGAGINFHLVTGRTIRSCPAPGGFPPCAESDQTYEINHAEFLLTGGVDFNLQLKGRFAMTPGFRVGLPARRAVPPILPKLGGTEVAPYYLLNINALYRF